MIIQSIVGYFHLHINLKLSWSLLISSLWLRICCAVKLLLWSGGEFLSTQFSKFLRDNGIIHQLSCPHTPEQNGCAERKHRHMVEIARTLLVASKVPHEFWVDAFATAIYLINRLPTAQHCSPWESLFHKPPEYTSLKIFGCQCSLSLDSITFCLRSGRNCLISWWWSYHH